MKEIIYSTLAMLGLMFALGFIIGAFLCFNITPPKMPSVHGLVTLLLVVPSGLWGIAMAVKFFG